MTNAPFREIDLTSIPGCHHEIQECSRGLAWLDHLFASAVNDLSDAEDAWATWEAKALAAARENARSGATAAEMRGLVTTYREQVEDGKCREAWVALRTAQRRKEKVLKFIDSLGKRQSAAQSALKGHENLGRYGGAV